MTKQLKQSSVPQLTIVEIEKSDSRPLGTDKEIRAHLLSLQNHPGFEEILRRFRNLRAMLRARLERPDEDENRHALRALIAAYGLVEAQLRVETGRPVTESRGAYSDEQAEFERLAKFVEIIGRTEAAS